MKTFTSLLIGCSLALAGAAWAQQPDQSASPTTKGKKPAAEKTHGAEAKPGANAAKPEETTAKQHGAMNAPAGAKGHKGEMTPKSETTTGAETGAKGHKGEMTPKSETTTGAETNVSGQPAASAAPGGKHQAGHRKGMNAPAENAKASPSATAAMGAMGATGATGATTGAAPSVSTQTNAQAGTAAGVKKADPQKVRQVKAQAAQIKQQHTTFRAQPKPDKVPAVTFNASYRIQGSEQWQGPQYEVFRSYHPERHDRGWYSSRYNRIELIGGGYYYWNNGYWYPAWGYEPSAEYYAYDAPIYVGHRAEPPDQVIADVQAELQQMGYYTGEVDGLLGPLTREAVAAYQADQGLAATAVIDQPTLDSLGLA